MVTFGIFGQAVRSDLLRDEGVGAIVAQRIEAARIAGDPIVPADARVVDGGTLGLDLLPMIGDAGRVVNLEAATPGAGLGEVRIAHLPAPRLCAHCAEPFDAAGADAARPACGGPGIAVAQPEAIELAWDDEPAAEGPEGMPGRDSRPSTPATAGGRL